MLEPIEGGHLISSRIFRTCSSTFNELKCSLTMSPIQEAETSRGEGISWENLIAYLCVFLMGLQNDHLVKHPVNQDPFKTFGNDNSLFQDS